MKSFVFPLCFFISQSLICQVTFIIKDLPEKHDYKSDIYISGDFESWSGGKDQFKLIQEDNEYSITIPKTQQTINFKFTLGSWDFVECDVNGNTIENRVYNYNKSRDTVAVKIANWTSDIVKEKASTASKNVHIFSEKFFMPQLNRERKIWVYLPPNYGNSSKKFPVLYMHDGQNVFDNKTSYAGEWEVDETLNRLSKNYGLNVIVIGIDNGNEYRFGEYSPWDNETYGKAEGDTYLEFIVKTLKPAIDKTYRTKTASKNTAIMGSSMGGLISHYAGLKYPEVFGKVGVFSPSFWYSESSFKFAKNHSKMKHSKMYFLVGSKEGKEFGYDMAKDMESMVEVMKANGFKKNNLYSKIVPDGIHSESFWRAEFENAIRWLFNN
jgi:predicted alpha/beta superfamily hydrolase